MTHELALSAGTIEYEDSGGVGPAVVLLPGLTMDASLWAEVIAQLPASYRCLAPTLPLGAHRVAVKEEADLSPRGIAGLVEELIERLDLDDVTLVGNDTGGAIAQLVAAGAAARIGGIVLVSCDAFDNFPPGLTGKTLVMSGKLPPALFGAFMQQLRLRFVRRLPISFGWLTKRGDAVVRECLAPVLSQREIRRDTVRLLRALAAEKDVLLEAAELLPAFDRPALVVWASEDRGCPPSMDTASGRSCLREGSPRSTTATPDTARSKEARRSSSRTSSTRRGTDPGEDDVERVREERPS